MSGAALGIALMLGVVVVCAAVQDGKTTDPPVRFWSGRVVELSDDTVTVRRSLPGREPELRKFVRTSATKVDGEIEVDSRVTIGYWQAGEANVAKRIVVKLRRRLE